MQPNSGGFEADANALLMKLEVHANLRAAGETMRSIVVRFTETRGVPESCESEAFRLDDMLYEPGLAVQLVPVLPIISCGPPLAVSAIVI
jgi:hypothetical protein